ncbi:MAG: hypothetical protein JWN46_3612 [Acidimicrobiales bacterium]|nr:hypothetical protein [Acidimicrobiales bacterium]
MRTRTMHRTIAVATLALASSLTVAPAAGAHTAAAPCSIGWGSLGKAQAGHTTGQIVAHGASQSACYDRFMIQVRGQVTGYYARYASEVDYVGTPFAMPLRGAAFIHLQVASRLMAGVATLGGDLAPVPTYSAFRQLSYAGSQAGLVHYGLGMRARLPFRITVVRGMIFSYLVVDVAHHW